MEGENKYEKLYDLMWQEYGLVLLESQLSDIYNCVLESQKKEEELNIAYQYNQLHKPNKD